MRYAAVELPTGRRFGLRWVEAVPDQLEILAPLTGDVQTKLSEVLAALGVPASCLTWTIPPEEWTRLRELHMQA